MPKFHSYKDLAVRFGKSVDTMKRWFGANKKMFRPSHQTALLPDDELQKFEQRHSGLAPSKKNGKR